MRKRRRHRGNRDVERWILARNGGQDRGLRHCLRTGLFQDDRHRIPTDMLLPLYWHYGDELGPDPWVLRRLEELGIDVAEPTA